MVNIMLSNGQPRDSFAWVSYIVIKLKARKVSVESSAPAITNEYRIRANLGGCARKVSSFAETQGDPEDRGCHKPAVAA